MNSSKDFGDGEKSNSSESGWTMYLCSSTNSDVSDIVDVEMEIEDGYVNKKYIAIYEDESDDSMASDASSGPIRVSHFLGNVEVGDSTYRNKVRVEGKNGEKCFANKKAKYNKQEKEEFVFTGKKEAEKSVNSSGKVRKYGWFGKRK